MRVVAEKEYKRTRSVAAREETNHYGINFYINNCSHFIQAF